MLTCTNQSITLSASSNASTYNWSGQSNHNDISVSSPVSYTLTATGSNGCTNSTSVSITEDKTEPEVSITKSPDTNVLTCTNSTITLGAVSDGATYNWSDQSGHANREITAGGTYTLTATGSNGCTNSTDVTLTEDKTAPDVTLTGTNEICLGLSTTLQTTSNANYTYLWSNGSTTSDNEVTPSATIEYTVTTTDSRNGCQTTGSRTVTVTTPTVGSSSYDYIWRGGSTDWNTAENWYMYSGGNYSVASTLPDVAKNYYIGTGACLPSDQWPIFSANTTVGNLMIASDSVTLPTDVMLSIAGSITGRLVAQNGSTIVLCGNDDQTFANATTFSNVRFAQSTAGKKIIAPNGINVNGEATFTTGIVSGNMHFGSDASTSGISINSYVDGAVTKELGSSVFTFPTGSNGVLGSVTVPATRAGGSATIRFNKSTTDGGFTTEEGYPRWWNINDMCSEDGVNRFDHVSNAEYWDITTTATLANVTFRAVAATDVHFNDTSINQRDAEAIRFALYDGCWKNMEGSTSITGGNSDLSVSNVTIPVTGRAAYKGTFGSLDDNTVLPIELTSFTATCDGRSTLIEWTTATERNNDYFSLERSDDAINFTEIARVAGAGNSIEPIDYTYTDYGIHGGDNYYRLVQVDYDGTRTASEIIVASCIEPEIAEPDVQAYPNPFNDELTVVLDNFGNRAATIEVYDMLGKLIYTDKIAAPQNSYETILNLSNLPPAAYTVRVSTTDFVINNNVVKQ